MQSLHADKPAEIKADSQRENPEVTTWITPSSALHSRVETLLPKLKLKPVMPYSDLPVLPVWVGRWLGRGLQPPAAWAASSTLGPITSGTNPSPDPIPSSQNPFQPWQVQARTAHGSAAPLASLHPSGATTAIHFPLKTASETQTLLFF